MNISLSAFCKQHDIPKSSAYRKAQEMGIDTAEGLTPEDCDRLLTAMGKTPAVKVEVETGNHAITLATPELPQTYSLEGLRQSEAISFEDPLAIAQQFLQVADQLQTAFDADIQAREQRLNQTRQAKEQIATKAAELKLEQRLYKLQTTQLDTQLSSETQDLQQQLQLLQKLGKPQDFAAG